MFVSILQRLGFKKLQPSGEPLKSPADHNAETGKTGSLHSSLAPAKNDESKAKQSALGKKKSLPKATTPEIQVVKAPISKQKNPAQPKEVVPTAVKLNMPTKNATTPTAKAVKPSVVKALPRPVVHLVTKPVTKIVVKTATKDAVKAVVDIAVAERTDTKKVIAGAVSQAGVKTVVLKVKAKKTLELPAAPAAVTPAIAPAPQPVHVADKPKSMISPPALKPGRRSSARVPSQLPPPAPMVPTHAPDAAKASYSTMTERVMAPPPHVAAKKDPKLANNWKAKPASELTDDEVKAMPDAEYMNDKQMAFFRHKLSVLKQEIHTNAGETTEHLREETVVVPDPADRATIEEEHALELRTRDRERKLLKKIEQSIGRIDSGDYGYCDETGEPIGVGRLIARPTASLSLEAQQRRELKQKMFGD